MVLDRLTFEVGLTRCSETSVTDYPSTLRNIPEERRTRLFHGCCHATCDSPSVEAQGRQHVESSLLPLI